MQSKNELKGNNISFNIVLYTDEYKDVVSDFDCGNEVINDYLKNSALSDSDNVTYLFVDISNNIIGFSTLCCSGIRYTVGKGYQSTLPAIEIKYFAILSDLHKLIYDETDEHFYFSDKVFCELLKICRDISQDVIGARYIVLYSVPDAVRFYKRNMFEIYTEYMSKDKTTFLNDCVPMFMEL